MSFEMEREPEVASTKPTILLCWGYHRKGWVEPFEKLKEEFDFVYLFHISKPRNEVKLTKSKVIYWADFSSPYDILEYVRPAKVVFMGLYSGYTIALNIACKAAGISTFYVQHGLFQQYSVYRQIEAASHKSHGLVPATPQAPEAANQVALRKKKGVFNFLLNALKRKDLIHFPGLVLYFYFMRAKGKFFAARHFSFDWRKPDYYVCHSPQNASIHFELDRPEPAQMLYIGVPEYDQFFAEDAAEGSSPINEPYYLLIDQPLAGSQYFNVGISREQVNQFYAKLLAFCKSRNAKLAIKLHPENYADTWLLQDPDLVYFREENVVPLIRNCEGCFGTFSTIFIPAIYYKPCVVFRLFNSYVQQHLTELGVVTDLDFFNFEAADIDFGKVEKLGTDCPEFIQDYLFRTDGNATFRLGLVLKGVTDQKRLLEPIPVAEEVPAG